jgi:two-component system, chemotaxis family, CheB/CheR fusion protein
MSLNDADHESGLLRAAGAAMLRGEDYFREVLEALPAGIYITDNSGRIIFYNHAAAKLWGRDPKLGTTKWCGSWKLFWSDGTPLPPDECPMALAIRECRSIRGAEGIIERPDGSRIPFVPYPTPLFDEEGTLVGAVNMFVDITDRKRSEEVDRRLVSIVESCDDAIISKDLNGIIKSWNGGAQRLFGYSAEEVVGRPITILIPLERQDEESTILDHLRRGDRVDQYETVRRRKDGTLVDISLMVSPLKNAEGEIIGASTIARDITELKQARQLQKLFVEEMRHRVKNTLSTVQAIASQTLHTASDDERNAFGARLGALASAHDLLTLENWNRASLRDIAERALKAFQEQHCERLSVNGPDDVWLNAREASLLAMALHELATNAVKYGALSNGKGQVRVEWNVVQNDQASRVTLSWQEIGGPAVVAVGKKGFGSVLIERALKAELGVAHLDFNPQGLTCTIQIKTACDQ